MAATALYLFWALLLLGLEYASRAPSWALGAVAWPGLIVIGLWLAWAADSLLGGQL